MAISAYNCIREPVCPCNGHFSFVEIMGHVVKRKVKRPNEIFAKQDLAITT